MQPWSPRPLDNKHTSGGTNRVIGPRNIKLDPRHFQPLTFLVVITIILGNNERGDASARPGRDRRVNIPSSIRDTRRFVPTKAFHYARYNGLDQQVDPDPSSLQLRFFHHKNRSARPVTAFLRRTNVFYPKGAGILPAFFEKSIQDYFVKRLILITTRPKHEHEFIVLARTWTIATTDMTLVHFVAFFSAC